MTVKNIGKYHDMSAEELGKLGTRELLNVLESSRGQNICSCGNGHHCGDEVIECDEQIFNAQQQDLYTQVKDILKDREDLTPKPFPKKIEKKKMRY